MGLGQSDQVGDEDGRAVLDVLCAAPVEEAITLVEGERIDRPVLSTRLNDVEMREQQQRTLGARAAESGDEVGLLGRRAEHVDVGNRESCILQTPGERFGGGSCGPVLVGRVELDQLLEDVAGALAIGGGRWRLPRGDQRW